MADIVDRATRSRMMSGIRSKNTKPELVVRSYLHRAGLRFRLHANLPGRPDIVFPRYRAAVFVHGCFWHRHEGCHNNSIPQNRRDWWLAKFNANVARDRRNAIALREQGWRVITIWECETQKPHKLQRLAKQIVGT
jgi:DNA mismatch endonuclease (patch repair protein)